MLSQSQSSLNHIDFQARFDHQRAQFKMLIDWFVPCWFTDRRNGNNTKLADEDLLALMCLKVHYQLTTWMALYRLVKHALPELAILLCASRNWDRYYRLFVRGYYLGQPPDQSPSLTVILCRYANMCVTFMPVRLPAMLT